MADAYTSTAFKYYTDSQNGTASATYGTVKTNVPVIYDRKYHRKAQTKLWWRQNGMIGGATYASGDIEKTDPALPVMRQTDFTKSKGDTLIIHQEEPMTYTHTGTYSMVGKAGLLGQEQTWGTNYQKVQIEEERAGLVALGGMSEQRMPYDVGLEQLMDEKLADWTANSIDTGLLYAMHYGFAPHIFRVFGYGNAAPTANYHTVYGNDITMTLSRTIANIKGDASDNLKPITFDIAYSYAKQNNFDMVNINGGEYLVALVSPKGMLALRQDEGFRNSVMYARERGITNPLFSASGAMLYGNCLIFEYDKIRSILGGYNPAGLTTANDNAYNSAITEAVFTGIGDGVAYSDLHQTYFLGARAIILAEGQMKTGLVRKEDDYGKIVGRAAHNIWGAKRNDWLNEAGAADNYANVLRIVNTVIL